MDLRHGQQLIVRRLLIDLGHGSDAGADWPVFANKEPIDPDAVITVYDTSGIQSGREMIDGEQPQTYGFQIRVRSVGPEDGKVKIGAIRESLLKGVYHRNVVVDTTTYFVESIVRVRDIIRLGPDQPNSDRNLFTVNAELQADQLP